MRDEGEICWFLTKIPVTPRLRMSGRKRSTHMFRPPATSLGIGKTVVPNALIDAPLRKEESQWGFLKGGSPDSALLAKRPGKTAATAKREAVMFERPPS